MTLDWIKTIPGYHNYFNEDHQFIIKLIGIDNYLTLYAHFSKTGLYFPGNYTRDRGLNDRQQAIELIGEDNYNRIYDHFGKTGIYFSSSSITKLKKAWVIINKDIDYYIAARTLDVSLISIYRWRQECSSEISKGD